MPSSYIQIGSSLHNDDWFNHRHHSFNILCIYNQCNVHIGTRVQDFPADHHCLHLPSSSHSAFCCQLVLSQINNIKDASCDQSDQASFLCCSSSHAHMQVLSPVDRVQHAHTHQSGFHTSSTQLAVMSCMVFLLFISQHCGWNQTAEPSIHSLITASQTSMVLQLVLWLSLLRNWRTFHKV